MEIVKGRRVTDRRGVLIFFLAHNGGGEGGGHLGLEIIQFGLEGQNGVIDLLLVVSVDPGSGENSNPAEGDNGEAVHDGAKVSEEIHGNSKLQSFNNILNQED